MSGQEEKRGSRWPFRYFAAAPHGNSDHAQMCTSVFGLIGFSGLLGRQLTPDAWQWSECVKPVVGGKSYRRGMSASVFQEA